MVHRSLCVTGIQPTADDTESNLYSSTRYLKQHLSGVGVAVFSFQSQLWWAVVPRGCAVGHARAPGHKRHRVATDAADTKQNLHQHPTLVTAIPGASTNYHPTGHPRGGPGPGRGGRGGRGGRFNGYGYNGGQYQYQRQAQPHTYNDLSTAPRIDKNVRGTVRNIVANKSGFITPEEGQQEYHIPQGHLPDDCTVGSKVVFDTIEPLQRWKSNALKEAVNIRVLPVTS